MSIWQRVTAITLCVLAFMTASLTAYAVVRESTWNDRVWSGTIYYNKARIDSGAENIQTEAWTSPSSNRDLAVFARQYYESNDNLCSYSTWLYDYAGRLNITLYGCSSGSFYSKGRSGFWRDPHQSYYYFDTFRTVAFTF